MIHRAPTLTDRKWHCVILDEAQNIKNAGSKQTKAVKSIASDYRLAITGTPIENRVQDLWSLFDFINPGLLGDAKTFADYTKKQAGASFSNLRKLVQPYILRRLKTDKTIIADLPDKTEMTVHCHLTPLQASAYSKTVDDLAKALKETPEGIKRRGLVLSTLMRLKQICNHPSQRTGDDQYDEKVSGKFQRLVQLAEEMASRQEKVLVFTQFRELCDVLHHLLAKVYARNGLVLHGSTPVKERQKLVKEFQGDGGPPFFILSLKAGGTGLNLTAASHVIHFDRWWNPAVENQATDRAFRIGQKRNVLVHKFLCVGTLEEKIDAMLQEKAGLARDVLGSGDEIKLTEMSNEEILQTLTLDADRALMN
jgi:non-specific serine/threonine protein kinase